MRLSPQTNVFEMKMEPDQEFEFFVANGVTDLKTLTEVRVKGQMKVNFAGFVKIGN